MLAPARVIVAGTKAVVLNRVSVYICAPQATELGCQAAGSDHVVVVPKTEVVMLGMTGPSWHEQ